MNRNLEFSPPFSPLEKRRGSPEAGRGPGPGGGRPAAPGAGPGTAITPLRSTADNSIPVNA